MSRRPKSSRTSGPPNTKEQLQRYVPYLVNQLSSLWTVMQNGELGKDNINAVVLRTLAALYIYRTLTVNEIAALAMTEQSTASRTIDTMVSAGWVERTIAAKDLRRRMIALTKDGEALLLKVWPAMEKNYANLTKGIAARDIDICANVLARMIDNMSGGDT